MTRPGSPASRRRPILITALGSSFASGPALTPIVDQRAARSSRNYAHRLAAQIYADLVDLTSAGATTADLLDQSQQFADGSRVRPQLDAVPEDTDVITLTVGGNDLQYVGTLTYAVLRQHQPQSLRTLEAAEQFPDGLALPSREAVGLLESRLADIFTALRRRAPGAQIFLVDYLTLIGPDSGSELGLPPNEILLIAKIQEHLERAHRDAAVAAGVELIPASALSRDHAIGAADPWVSGLLLEPEQWSGSFHPNAAGMQHVADLLTRRVEALLL